MADPIETPIQDDEQQRDLIPIGQPMANLRLAGNAPLNTASPIVRAAGTTAPAGTAGP
jgi:hypothetical protein